MKWFTVFWICATFQLIANAADTDPATAAVPPDSSATADNSAAAGSPTTVDNSAAVDNTAPADNSATVDNPATTGNTANTGNSAATTPDASNPQGTSTASASLVTPKRPVRCSISIMNYRQFETGLTRAINGIDRMRDNRQPRIDQMKDFFKRGSNTMFIETMRRYQRKSVSLTPEQRINYAKVVETAIQNYRTIRDKTDEVLNGLKKESESEKSLMALKDVLDTTNLKLATTRTELIVFPKKICDVFNSIYALVQTLVDEIMLKSKK